MRMRGIIRHEDVYANLLDALTKLDPTTTATEVGMTLRDKTVEHVKEGFVSGKWTTWVDCHKLI